MPEEHKPLTEEEIRRIVREEVRKVIREEVHKALQEMRLLAGIPSRIRPDLEQKR